MTPGKKGNAKPTAASKPIKAGMAEPDSTELKQSGQGSSPDFPIVGIGASAGGLAAFEAFFSGMPVDTDPNMAFVLVQHLAPDHKSILTDLIRRYTSMQVFEVQDGMKVCPNCAFIIPPGRDMAFLGGSLQLFEPAAPRGQRLPIDFFFRSLAQDLRERAICVVLSGTGSDGALGVRAIKGGGGMVMVQKPESSEYDGMPRSALATGLVDYELPPADMVSQIMNYVAHAFGKPSRLAKPTPKAESTLKKISVLLRSQTGHDFSDYKPSTITRRIERRMAIHQIESIEGYVKFLQHTQDEVTALFRDLLIGVTNFFRDPQAFKVLEEKVIPKLFAGKQENAMIRVWSVGCSTGEEAYSLAILLAEHQKTMKESFQVQVFATDIDSNAVATARAGIYPASIATDITPERLTGFFGEEPDKSAFRIHRKIRDMLIFSEQSVIKDPPFSKLDLISCRNLLIYMNADLQKKLMPLFHYALSPGGYLFLGTSETVGEFSDLFAALDRKAKLYRRQDNSHRAQRVNLGNLLSPMKKFEEHVSPQAARQTPPPAKLQLRELTEQALLQYVALMAALVNDQGDILYLHGRTGIYLEPSPGEAGLSNILKMARQGLRRALTTALHKVAKSKKSTSCPNLRVKTNGDFITADLVVQLAPSTNPASDESMYLVILQQAKSENKEHARDAQKKKTHKNEDNSDTEKHVAELRRGLQEREEYLHAINEELETSNEELMTYNEEMQSINEELQSTNEELETSKEELQSANEELTTLNSELQTNVAELYRVNNDMNNLLAGTGIATVFVDHGLRILRFTPFATKIINLIKSDVGRPVGHIVSNLVNYDHLVEDIQTVLDTLVPWEAEVQTTEDQWFTMRILPYRTLDNVIEGAVLTFVNITESRKLQNDLHRQKQRLQVALSASPVVLSNQDTDLRYTWILNADLLFTAKQIIGKTDADLFSEQEASQLAAIKLQVLEDGQSARESVRITSQGKPMILNITVEPLLDSTGTIIGITCASLSITGQEGTDADAKKPLLVKNDGDTP